MNPMLTMFAQASPTEDTRIAQFLFDRIGTSVTTFVNDGSATMIGIIGPVATSLLIIYVLLWGMAMASGQISEPFTNGMRRIVRMCVIIAFALTVGIYQGVVADFFKEAPMQIASQMTMPGGEATSDVDSMAKMLDNCLSKGFAVARKPWDKGAELSSDATFGISGDGLGFMGLSIFLYIIVVIVVAIAASLVFVAYMALAILLAIGPLFILMAIFPQTQRWFEAWLGQAANYMIMFVLVALACGLLFTMLGAYFDDLKVQSLHETLMSTLKAIGLTIAMVAVLTQMTSVAAALGGGAAVQAANVGGKLAGMGMAAATGGASAVMGARALGYGMSGKDAPERSNSNSAGRLIKKAGDAMARRTTLTQRTVREN